MQPIFGENRINELFGNIAGKRIGVIGDVMLDQYYWGSVSRVSPEAPVPVVEIKSESVRLGGAANVANNIASLGAEPFLIGVVGNDGNSEILSSLMNEYGFTTDGLLKDPARPTTVKTRIIAHNQHVVRFDRESVRDLNESIAHRLIDILKDKLSTFDGLILQDYNKGIFTKLVIDEITNLAYGSGLLITVDPKFNNFFEYRNVTVFKPNRRELEQAFGERFLEADDYVRCGRELIKRLDARNILITRGEQGMTLIEKNGSIHHVPTRARSVADVSGAGDTVIATLTVLMASGANIVESSAIANFAGGVVCEEVGIVPIARERLINTILRFERENADFVTREGVQNG